MKVEKTINICGMDVRMRYCAAAETGYETLSGKSAAVFAPIEVKDENGEEQKAVSEEDLKKAEDSFNEKITQMVCHSHRS